MLQMDGDDAALSLEPQLQDFQGRPLSVPIPAAVDQHCKECPEIRLLPERGRDKQLAQGIAAKDDRHQPAGILVATYDLDKLEQHPQQE